MAEVVPVSSSAQLVLVPWLLGWPPPPDRTTFAAGLHAGSCLGIAWALRSDLRALDRRTAALVAVASVPAALAGLVAADAVEERLGRPPQLAAALAGAGALMWWVDARACRREGARGGGPVSASVPRDGHDRRGRGRAQRFARRDRRRAAGTHAAGPLAELFARRDRRREAGTHCADPAVPVAAALLAGAAQVVALVPGVSRSGATLTALRAAGVARAEAERFSLLMSLPVTAGAAGLTLLRARRAPAGTAPGALAAALAGAVAASRVGRHPGTPLRGAALFRIALAAAVAVRLRRRSG